MDCIIWGNLSQLVNEEPHPHARARSFPVPVMLRREKASHDGGNDDNDDSIRDYNGRVSFWMVMAMTMMIDG